MMQLYFAATSAYVRKVMVCATVLGLADEIEPLDSAAHPISATNASPRLTRWPKSRHCAPKAGYAFTTVGSFANTSTRVPAAGSSRKAATCAGAAWQDRRWAMG